MSTHQTSKFFTSRPGKSWLLASALATVLLLPIPTLAFQFETGDLKGSLDSTISYGAAWRVDDQDPEIIGIANSAHIDGNGTAYSVNGDDGNLNYDKGDLISNAAKITSDLSLKYKNFGLFVRGSAFYDFENNDGERVRTPLTDEALDMVGTDVDLLDAYVSMDFNVAGMPAQIRVGDQVISWGESTFIQNSINSINPVDVSKIRVPGAELKEALIPVGIVSASISPTENISVEGFYQYKWEETAIDPPGSYWSTNDFAGDGGYKIFLGFGTPGLPDSLDPTPGFPIVPRGPTVEADDDGQYGLAMRVYAPNLNDTEFGFYFMNYHSRVPIISAVTGNLAIPAIYVSTARYFTEYPEDIKLYGVSFNTLLSGSGIALQGEYSYRQDVPLQVDDVELLFAALSPTSLGMATLNQVSTYRDELYGVNTVIHGFEKMDVSQIQMTATKAFGPTLGADQFVLLGEAGLTHVHDMPNKDELRFESQGTYISGNTALSGAHTTAPGVIEPADAFADANSWGYRIVGKLDFNNAIGAVTLSPRIAWAHDVSGNSPGPGGNFLEDRKAITLGLGADYQNTWSADLSYTDYFGAGRYNLINDRDFIALNIKYSF